jgi:hypothetical protein
MPHNNHIFLDMTKVLGAAAVATTVTLSQVNTILTTVSICLAIAYTIYKWVKDLKK